MYSYFNTILFGYYPYVAFTVFIVGSITRYKYDPYQWKSGSSQILNKKTKSFYIGNVLFHIGILALFFGHFVGLLTPTGVYTKFISLQTKQLMAMVIGGFFGLICFVGMTILVHRRLFIKRIRQNSSFSDIFILLLIYVQLILGLASISVSIDHLDGSAMVALSYWTQGILTFESGASQYILKQHWIFKTHIFLGLTVFLVFPFTRLVHVMSVPIGYLFRTGYQIVRVRGN